MTCYRVHGCANGKCFSDTVDEEMLPLALRHLFSMTGEKRLVITRCEECTC